MKADLHLHSRHSDGTENFEYIIQKAKNEGITHLSFTNHDSMCGTEDAVKLAHYYQMECIPGIEISAFDFQRHKKVHLLGYGMTNRAMMDAFCAPILKRRTENTLKHAEILMAEGYPINKKILREVGQHSNALYKQHMMEVFVRGGLMEHIYDQLYVDLYKNNGILTHMDIEYADVIEALMAIKESGGIAVLAHPGQLDSFDILPELVAHGLDGIEVYHFDHTPEDIIKAMECARDYHLLIFGGSDYHGSNGPDHLGKVYLPGMMNIRAILERIAGD